MTLQELPVKVLSRDEYLAAHFRMAGHYPHVLTLADHAFRWAGKKNSEDLMVHVLRHGAPLDVKALLCSTEVKGNPKAMALLKAESAAIDPIPSFIDRLHTACFYGELRPVVALLDRVPSKKKILRSKDHRGQTALHKAVCIEGISGYFDCDRSEDRMQEKLELVYRLLSLGADPTEKDMKGRSALDLANRLGHDEFQNLKEKIKTILESPPTLEADSETENMESPADTIQTPRPVMKSRHQNKKSPRGRNRPRIMRLL